MKSALFFIYAGILCTYLWCAAPACALDDTETLLGLDSAGAAGQQQPTFPYPISTIAENVTVLTAEDISRLNAHTLADLLQTVPGVQLLQVQTPGSRAAFSISGAHSRHILVLIDGVSQNLLGAEESAELAMIPAQRIERVEIVKGPASTAWGTAIGGVVNVITKSPDAERRLAGIASGSLGTGGTSDLRVEASGTQGRFGYYLTGGRLRSDGLVPGNGIDFEHAYGKFLYALPGRGSLTATLDYRDGARGVRVFDTMPGLPETDTEGSRYLTASLQGRYPLSPRLDLAVNGSIGRRDVRQDSVIASGAPQIIFAPRNRDDFEAADANLSFRQGPGSLTAGVAFQHDAITDDEPVMQFDFLNFRSTLTRYSAFANGGWTAGPLTVLPGLRFETTDRGERSLCYNLGVTWRLSENDLIRVYAARGHGLPVVNFHDKFEDIWTVQAGMESSAIRYLWLKGGLFYNRTWDIQTPNVPADYPASPITTASSAQISQGFEVEAQTVPRYGVFLKGGYTYTDARDTGTGNRVDFIPVNSAKLAVNYDQAGLGLRATLTGNYVTWPASTGDRVTDGGFLWDLHLVQKLLPQKELSPELFVSVHNLFNGSQYLDDFQKNAPRWFEGGLRCRF